MTEPMSPANPDPNPAAEAIRLAARVRLGVEALVLQDAADLDFAIGDATTSARHEAAHAVVAHALWIRVTRMTLEDAETGKPMCWTNDRVYTHLGEHVAQTLAGYFQERLDGVPTARADAAGDLEDVVALRSMFDADPAMSSWYGSWWRFFLHWTRISKRAVAAYQTDIAMIASELILGDGELDEEATAFYLAAVTRMEHAEIHFARAEEAA
jgi:hypothetical protein